MPGNTQVQLLLFRIEIPSFDVFWFIDLNSVLVFLLSIEGICYLKCSDHFLQDILCINPSYSKEAIIDIL